MRERWMSEEHHCFPGPREPLCLDLPLFWAIAAPIFYRYLGWEVGSSLWTVIQDISAFRAQGIENLRYKHSLILFLLFQISIVSFVVTSNIFYIVETELD